MRWQHSIYTTKLQSGSTHLYGKESIWDMLRISTLSAYRLNQFLDTVNGTGFEGWEVEKALKFREQIYNIYKQAHEMFQWANAKAKARHDKHRIPHSFQIGDQVWLHLKKERFYGPYKKMTPLRYVPYNILKQIGENSFHLDIPAFLGLHLVFNVDLLQPYHASLLEHNEL